MNRSKNDRVPEWRKKISTIAKQFLFSLAQYNPATKKIEFNYEDVVSRIKQATGKSNPFIVVATAVGQPKSGKTSAVNRLVECWHGDLQARPHIRFPEDRCGTFQGIQLLFSDVPRVVGSNFAYLICLDVVCNPDSLAYKPLMEACYRVSNLIIFTFSKKSKSQKLVEINYYGAIKDFKAAASFRGYSDWASAHRSYYDRVEFLNFFESALAGNDENTRSIKDGFWSLLSVVGEFSIQVEQAFEVYSKNSGWRNGNGGKEVHDIYSNLVQSLREDKLRKERSTSSELADIFLMMATRAMGELAKANGEQNRNNTAEEHPDSDFDVLLKGTIRNPARNFGKAHQRETKSADVNEEKPLADPPKVQKKSRSTSAGPQCWKDRRSKANLPLIKDVDADLSQSSAGLRKDQASNRNDANQNSTYNSVVVVNEVVSSGTGSVSATRSSRRSRPWSLSKAYLKEVEVVHDNKLPRASAEVSEHFEELSADESTLNHGTCTPLGTTVKLTGSDANPHGASSYFSNHTSGKEGNEKNGRMNSGNAEACPSEAKEQRHQGAGKKMAGDNLPCADPVTVKGDISMELDFEGDTTIKETASYRYHSPSSVTRYRNLNGNMTPNYRVNKALQPLASASAESSEAKARTHKSLGKNYLKEVVDDMKLMLSRTCTEASENFKESIAQKKNPPKLQTKSKSTNAGPQSWKNRGSNAEVPQITTARISKRLGESRAEDLASKSGLGTPPLAGIAAKTSTIKTSKDPLEEIVNVDTDDMFWQTSLTPKNGVKIHIVMDAQGVMMVSATTSTGAPIKLQASKGPNFAIVVSPKPSIPSSSTESIVMGTVKPKALPANASEVPANAGADRILLDPDVKTEDLQTIGVPEEHELKSLLRACVAEMEGAYSRVELSRPVKRSVRLALDAANQVLEVQKPSEPKLKQTINKLNVWRPSLNIPIVAVDQESGLVNYEDEL